MHHRQRSLHRESLKRPPKSAVEYLSTLERCQLPETASCLRAHADKGAQQYNLTEFLKSGFCRRCRMQPRSNRSRFGFAISRRLRLLTLHPEAPFRFIRLPGVHDHPSCRHLPGMNRPPPTSRKPREIATSRKNSANWRRSPAPRFFPDSHLLYLLSSCGIVLFARRVCA